MAGTRRGTRKTTRKRAITTRSRAAGARSAAARAAEARLGAMHAVTTAVVPRPRLPLDQAIEGLDICRPDEWVEGEKSIGQYRRRGLARIEDGIGVMSLIERDGVLFWESGLPAPVGRMRRRARRGEVVSSGELVAHYKFRELAPSQVYGFL